jgi:DNA-binding beta-propeller fold protein YncE
MKAANRFFVIIAAVIAAAGLSRASAQAVEGTLVVANRDGGSISFVDLGTGTEMARHAIGPRIPHEVAISPNGRLALSSEYGPNDDPGSTVLVFDVPSARLLGEIDLGPQTRPHSLAFLPDGRRAVVTMERADAIALIDVLDRRVIATYPTGGTDSHMVRVSPDGETAYATGRGGTGTVSIIDLTGERDTVVIETGAGAEGLAVSPDGSEVWIANRRAASITVVDTQRRRVAATIDAPAFVGRVDISPAGRVLVPNGSFGSESAPQQLTLYDLDSRAVTAQHRVRPAQENTGGFNIHISGEIAFVSDRTSGAIVIYDLEAFPAATVLFAEHDSPDGLGYSPLRMSVLTR